MNLDPQREVVRRRPFFLQPGEVQPARHRVGVVAFEAVGREERTRLPPDRGAQRHHPNQQPRVSNHAKFLVAELAGVRPFFLTRSASEEEGVDPTNSSLALRVRTSSGNAKLVVGLGTTPFPDPTSCRAMSRTNQPGCPVDATCSGTDSSGDSYSADRRPDVDRGGIHRRPRARED